LEFPKQKSRAKIDYQTIGYYPLFRMAIPNLGVRTCLLLPRLPLTAHSAETPSSNIQAPNKSQ